MKKSNKTKSREVSLTVDGMWEIAKTCGAKSDHIN